MRRLTEAWLEAGCISDQRLIGTALHLTPAAALAVEGEE